tara:strand:- start:395 stop:1066 length:672 start_codon:yes stop_codon:yes gene_type:complete
MESIWGNIQGLLGLNQPQDYFKKTLIERPSLLNESNRVIKNIVSDSPDITREILNSVKESEGGYQRKRSDRLNWTSGKIGKGRLVGTNRGVTPQALAKYRKVSPNTITTEQIKNVTKEDAENIYMDQYIKPYKIFDFPEEAQLVLGNIVPLRPDAIRVARKNKVKTKQQAVDSVIQSYSEIPQKGKFYNDNIRGWINRTMRTAGLPEFKNKEEVFRKYPKLRK